MGVDLTRRFDRVAIVGFCKPHRDWVPYDEEDLEVWGLNRGVIFMPRANRWFELHGPAIHEWQQRRPGNHLGFLQRFPGPVYMHQARADIIPNAVDYPLREVADDVGSPILRVAADGVATSGREEPYLTSTVALEIALAIHLGYREIGLYGIDLNTASEYAFQKPGVEHMLGVAVGRGIKVIVPDMCPLLKGNIYGRGYLSPRGETLSPEQWEERIRALQAQKQQYERQLSEAVGGKREVEYLLTQMVPGMDHEAMDERRQNFEKAIANLQAQAFQLIGALHETLFWAHQTPAGQDPREALGQLIAAEGPDAQAFVHQTIADELGTAVPAEGPEEDSVDAALFDVATGDPGRWPVLEGMPAQGGQPSDGVLAEHALRTDPGGDGTYETTWSTIGSTSPPPGLITTTGEEAAPAFTQRLRTAAAGQEGP